MTGVFAMLTESEKMRLTLLADNFVAPTTTIQANDSLCHINPRANFWLTLLAGHLHNI